MTIPPLDRFLREQPAFALSLAYLLIGVVGSFYYYRLFAEFGINVFEFAEVSDFLLVVFRQPLIPGLFLAFGLLVYLLYHFHRYLRKRVRPYDSAAARWLANHYHAAPYLLLAVAAIPVLLIWIIPFCANQAAEQIRQGRTRVMEVYLNAEVSDRAPYWRTMRLIGSTGRFLIFYTQEEGTQIIPAESILRIVLPTVD